MLHTALSGLEDLSSVIFQKLIISCPSFIMPQLAGNLKNSIKKTHHRVGVREQHFRRVRVRHECAVAKRNPLIQHRVLCLRTHVQQNPIAGHAAI